MKLFNLIKGQSNTNLSPEQVMRCLIDEMPQIAQKDKHIINCVEFLDNREWELALDSLIDFGDESENHFVEDFWLRLADSADKMKLPIEANYCRQQIG